MKFLSILIICTALLHVPGWAAEDGGDIQWPTTKISDFKSFSDYFESRIPYYEKSLDPSLIKESYAAFGDSAFFELMPYLDHKSKRVRWFALCHLWRFAQIETNLAKSQTMVNRLLSSITNSDEGDDQWIANRLLVFSSEHYNKEGKKILVRLLDQPKWNTHTLKSLILIAGIVSTKDQESSIERHRSTLGWPVSLAMARRGNAADLKQILEVYDPEKPTKPEPEPSIFGVPPAPPRFPAPLENMSKYFAGLGYTKQPEAIEKLVKYAFREDMNPASYDVGADYLAGRALEVLAGIFKGLPKQHSFQSPAGIADGRAWLKENYSREKLPDILVGEVEPWVFH